MIKELGIDNLLDNPTYTPTPPTTKDNLDNNRYVVCSFKIAIKDDKLDIA